jgi:hypothetical protein
MTGEWNSPLYFLITAPALEINLEYYSPVTSDHSTANDQPKVLLKITKTTNRSFVHCNKSFCVNKD